MASKKTLGTPVTPPRTTYKRSTFAVPSPLALPASSEACSAQCTCANVKPKAWNKTSSPNKQRRTDPSTGGTPSASPWTPSRLLAPPPQITVSAIRVPRPAFFSKRQTMKRSKTMP
ncbi:uncharacterized protein EHS24_008588 [Apiotrichum porosum]|uniref:Uncharacterized protein n=1 Tax=Apiotrichum porosum TaxID=105984 RepID=A0A427XQR6_9TREE|nr:uncharacterized protein EHS24_008588 [Apiotrichum porosum]RSH81153.1 hypothetical protein EHS24_008588 [Apiotrichum porosum]